MLKHVSLKESTGLFQEFDERIEIKTRVREGEE